MQLARTPTHAALSAALKWSIGSLSNKDDDGNKNVIRDLTIGRRDGSENVASKMNLRSFGLYRDFSNSLTLWNVVANPPGVEFLRTTFKLTKRIKFRRPLFTFSLKSKIRQFHVVVVQKRQRNLQESEMHVQSCCFARPNLLLFWRSRCRRVVGS